MTLYDRMMNSIDSASERFRNAIDEEAIASMSYVQPNNGDKSGSSSQ